MSFASSATKDQCELRCPHLIEPPADMGNVENGWCSFYDTMVFIDTYGTGGYWMCGQCHDDTYGGGDDDW